jgi:hypothetical protein
VPARVLRGFEYSTPVVFLSATRARCIELTVQVTRPARQRCAPLSSAVDLTRPQCNATQCNACAAVHVVAA